MEREARRDITHAWHVAALAAQAMFGKQGLQPLAKLVSNVTPRSMPARDKAAQQRAEWLFVAESLGMKVKTQEVTH